MPARTTWGVFRERIHRHSVALALAGLGSALAIAACGGSGSAGTGSQAGYNVALKFSQCMRAHGLTNFPDPGAGGGIQIGGPGSNLDPASPSFQAAQRACARYAPFKGGPPHMSEAQRVAAFRFAKCVRAHGYPDFPDPSESVPRGPGPRAVLALHGMVFAFSSAFDPRSPAFQRAAADCGLHLPGPGARARGKVTLAP
jgi:hypothetical protein